MALIDEVRAGRLPSPDVRRAIRRAANVSQVRMAEELDVHRVTFVHWEKGTREPRHDARVRYAQLLAELQRIT